MQTRKARHREDPRNRWAFDQLSEGQNALGKLYLFTNQPDKAYASFRRRTSILDQLSELVPDSLDYPRNRAMTEKRLMEVCLAQGHVKEAMEHYNAYDAYFRTAARNRPEDCRCQFDAAMTQMTAGELLDACGQPQDAAQCYANAGEALICLLPLLPNDYLMCDDVAYQFLALTQVAARSGRRADADNYLAHANSIRQRMGRPAPQIENIRWKLYPYRE